MVCLGHYLRELDLSWDDVLNMAKVQLELISDVEMYLFFEKSLRGRVFYIFKRYNKYSNNLHSYAMYKFLTTF